MSLGMEESAHQKARYTDSPTWDNNNSTSVTNAALSAIDKTNAHALMHS